MVVVVVVVGVVGGGGGGGGMELHCVKLSWRTGWVFL